MNAKHVLLKLEKAQHLFDASKSDMYRKFKSGELQALGTRTQRRVSYENMMEVYGQPYGGLTGGLETSPDE